MIILKDSQKQQSKLLSDLPLGTIFKKHGSLGIRVQLEYHEAIKAVSMEGQDYWNNDNFEVDEIITDINKLSIV
jgi:hypothetical protein